MTILPLKKVNCEAAAQAAGFKLLLFVMVDGWNLLVGSLVNSFML